MAPKMVGPFELGKCVGKGATASVYLAHEPNMRKEVAIKVLKHSQNSVKSIRHEINIMTVLAHENVSQIYTTIQQHGCTNLVMEIIGGGELFDTVKQWKRDHRERLTFHYFSQLMTGLRFLHDAGFAHRDLKLENLLLSTDGVLKIADFGVTKDLKLNPMKTCCGSPDYIAPEIITDKRGYDGRLADIWSCGVILYAMLAGEFPFENASHILRGLYKTPKWFPKLAKDSLLDKILVVDPAKRIQSVGAIMLTEWMCEYKMQRNTVAMLRDITEQLKALDTSGAEKTDSKERAVLRCRYHFLRVTVMIKIINALKSPSIKGSPRNVAEVLHDRLYSTLALIQDMLAEAGLINWSALRDTQQYQTQFRLLGEVHRAMLKDLTSEERLATFLNMYHMTLIHGFAAGGEHLSQMRKDKQIEFFESTSIVVGYTQFSLNDIFHGVLRGNAPKPGGGGLFGSSEVVHVSEKLYPEKLVLSPFPDGESANPIVHCVLSHLTSCTATIAVYDSKKVHEQIKEVAEEFLRKNVSVNAKSKCMTLPLIFKEYAKDFGKQPQDVIAWVRGYLTEAQQKDLDGMCVNGVCSLKYHSKDTSFDWRHLPRVKEWQKSNTKRFDWTEQRKHLWMKLNPERFALKTRAAEVSSDNAHSESPSSSRHAKSPSPRSGALPVPDSFRRRQGHSRQSDPVASDLGAGVLSPLASAVEHGWNDEDQTTPTSGKTSRKKKSKGKQDQLSDSPSPTKDPSKKKSKSKSPLAKSRPIQKDENQGEEKAGERGLDWQIDVSDSPSPTKDPSKKKSKSKSPLAKSRPIQKDENQGEAGEHGAGEQVAVAECENSPGGGIEDVSKNAELANNEEGMNTSRSQNAGQEGRTGEEDSKASGHQGDSGEPTLAASELHAETETISERIPSVETFERIPSIEVKRLEEACEIAKYPVCGTARIVLKQDQALVLAPDDTGEMSAQLLTVKQRLELMEISQQTCRSLLMQRACQHKVMAQAKNQPDIKLRYSEKKHKHHSVLSAFCVIS